MMRLMRSAALVLSLPVASAWGLFGQCGDYFQPLVDIVTQSDYYVSGDLLYWTHSDCDYGYAARLQAPVTRPAVPLAPPAVTGTIGGVDVHHVKPGYDPGFRVHVGLSNPCGFIELNFARVEIDSSRTTKYDINSPLQPFLPTFLVSNAFFGAPNKITGTVRSEYQVLDFLASTHFAHGKWGSFHATLDARWVDLTHHRNTSAFLPGLAGGTTVSQREKVTFNGGGMGFRFIFESNFTECGLSAFAHVGLTSLIGRQRMTRSGTQTFGAPLAVAPFAISEEVTVPGRTCFVPQFMSSLGLRYDYACDCFNVRLNIGWELDWYQNALSYRVGQQAINPPLAEDIFFGSIGYGGPTIELLIGF